MMKARSFSWQAVGITPLVMNNNAGMLNGPIDKGRDKAAYEREHYQELCYSTPTGGLYIPARAVKKSALLACKFITDKPKGVGVKSFGPILEGALLVDADAMLDVPLKAAQPWPAIVNLDPSKGPKGPRGPRTRPRLPLPWKAETTITVLDDLLTLPVLSAIFEAAGTRCGLLDARTIDYGRCHITIKEV